MREEARRPRETLTAGLLRHGIRAVEKGPGDTATGGTINGSGLLRLKVTRSQHRGWGRTQAKRAQIDHAQPVMYSGLKPGACPRGSNRRAFGSPCFRPIDIPAGPRGCMRKEHVAAHPQVYSPPRQGVRATRARRSRGSPPLSLSLREPMQEGCTVPVTPKLPSTVRRCPTAPLAWVPLASGALHLLVPRTAWRVKSPPRRSRGPSATADPIPLWAKARSLLGFFFVSRGGRDEPSN